MERNAMLTDIIAADRPKKMLAIDGGGIRGVIALQVLGRLEAMLGRQSGRTDFRLCEYFDYMAGTSTGAIIAAGRSFGMSVSELQDLYVNHGNDIFKKAAFHQHRFHRYDWHRPHGSLRARIPISRPRLKGDNVLRLHNEV